MRKTLSVFLIVLTVLFCQKSLVSAQETGKTILVSKDTVVDHDYFAVGELVTISGTINGDVYALAKSITIDGNVNGDVLSASQNFNLFGSVANDLRIASGDVFINGAIEGNFSAAAGNITITPQSKIGGNLVFLGNYLGLEAKSVDDVQIFGKKALVNGQIFGNLNARADEIELGGKAVVSKDFNYWGAKNPEISDEASISGETIVSLHEDKTQPAFGERLKSELISKKTHLRKLRWVSEVFGFLISLTFGSIFYFLFPKRYRGMADVLKRNFWQSLGLGFLTLLSFGFFSIMLLVSLVGIPIMVTLGPLFILFAYLSRTFTAYCLGELILSKTSKTSDYKLALLIGLVIYYFLRLIPVVRTFDLLVFVSLGLGAFILDQRLLHKSK